MTIARITWSKMEQVILSRSAAESFNFSGSVRPDQSVGGLINILVMSFLDG